MANYIDGFTLPIPRNRLDDYRDVAHKVAEIWKEHGALAYFEYVGDDMNLEGTRSFAEVVDAKEDEAVVFGWVVFESRETRDLANARVPVDPRMTEIIAPLVDPSSLIFDPSRMVYGGFEAIVESDGR